MAKKTTGRKTASSTDRATAAKRTSLESELSRCDREIIRLLNKRADTTTKLLELSPNPSKAVFDPNGDAALRQKLSDSNKGPLPDHALHAAFREILSAARAQVKMIRVAYLGPAYSFTHLAAIEHFGTSVEFLPVANIAAVFEEVNRRNANFGIVPIENSTDGRIVDTLDMFTRIPLKVCAEVQLTINHHLLARCPRSEITEVYSKPQALSQCREWLSKNLPQARLVEVSSTSTAALMARDKPGAAAVASQQAGVANDLQVVAENIQDNRHNVTRFAVVGDEINKPSGSDKTAILLQIPHKPGALADALVAFKQHKVNLTWIESFPLKGPESGYLFFLDFEGHSNDARVKKTIAELQKHAIRLEDLGSYPKSEPVT